jgi:hypothetical protein
MFKRIKCITNRHPRFLKEVYKHDVLIDLQNDERFIKRGEPFIRWDDGAWDLWRMADPPRMMGRFENLGRAVFYGRSMK